MFSSTGTSWMLLLLSNCSEMVQHSLCQLCGLDVGFKMVVAPHELLCCLCLELVASSALMIIVFTKFLFFGIQYYSCDETVRSCGPLC